MWKNIPNTFVYYLDQVMENYCDFKYDDCDNCLLKKECDEFSLLYNSIKNKINSYKNDSL